MLSNFFCILFLYFQLDKKMKGYEFTVNTPESKKIDEEDIFNI